MIVDTSALMAIVQDEPDAEACARAIEEAGVRRMSAANLLEAGIVTDAIGDAIASRRLDEIIRAAGIRIEPVTVEQADIGRRAYRDFGKGSGHPAQLNFGDCFAYALAAATDEPLLYKGDDFDHTDVASALDSGR
jgi:ribonuclease VapC